MVIVDVVWNIVLDLEPPHGLYAMDLSEIQHNSKLFCVGNTYTVYKMDGLYDVMFSLKTFATIVPQDILRCLRKIPLQPVPQRKN